MFVAHVFDEIPEAGVDEELFVVAEAVEEIEDWKSGGFVGVERGWENDAVGNGAREDFAGDGVALDAAGGGGGGEVEAAEERRVARVPWLVIRGVCQDEERSGSLRCVAGVRAARTREKAGRCGRDDRFVLGKVNLVGGIFG